ncbi:MAG: hypothetical protein R3F30_00105 [Planctomycetota bacterium]
MRSIHGLAALVLLTSGAFAQIIITEKQDDQDKPVAKEAEAGKLEVAKEPGPHAGLFYKAFYLYQGARKYDDAVAALREYLAKAPNGHHAPQAANMLVQGLFRTDHRDEAEKARETYAQLIELDRSSRPMGGFGGPGGQGDRAGGRQQRGGNSEFLAQLEERVKQAKEELEKAKGGGDEEAIAAAERTLDRLSRQLERARQAGAGEGGQGGQGRQGGRGFGRMGTPFPEMSKEELDQAVQGMDRMVEMVSQRMGEEQAKELKTKVDEIKGLIKDGKLDEAQKVRDDMMQGFRRRR